VDCKVVPGISDHEAVYVETQLNLIPTPETPRQIFFWDKANFNLINDLMMQYSTEFLSIYSPDTPVEVLWTAFKTKCHECLELIPQTVSSKNHFKAPWINAHIKQISNRKKKAYNRAHSTGLPSDWSKYRNLKKLSEQECRKAYNQYVRQLVSPENDYNHKHLWSYIKSRRQENIGISTLKDDR